MIVGIDPGISGALALLSARGAFCACVPMPTTRLGTKGNKQQIDVHDLARTMRAWLIDDPQFVVVLENVSAMPGQGVVSMFSFGRGTGRIEGVVAALGISLEYVTPRTWKAHFKLDRDKENARALAQRLFPQADLSRKKDAGMAEALLIAKFWHDTKMGAAHG